MVERLFSYGTLQQNEVQMALFGHLLKGDRDALVGYRQQMVEITDPEVVAESGNSFHPIVVPGDESDRVFGTVFQVTAADLAAVDKYEVSDYQRVAAVLASGMTTWVYVKSS